MSERYERAEAAIRHAIEAQAARIAEITDALARTQWMLESIDRSHATNFSEVRERILANRTALRGDGGRG